MELCSREIKVKDSELVNSVVIFFTAICRFPR